MTEADRMIELLRYASQAKVATALGVSRTTTGEWARGRNVTPFRLRQVEDLLRPQRAGEQQLDPTNGELLTEMRAIRRLLQRQAPAALTDDRLAAAAAEGARIALERAGLPAPSQPPGGSRPRARKDPSATRPAVGSGQR